MSDRLTALHSSVERLRDIVEGLDPQQLELPAYPVEWSIADVLSHIGSGAVILRRRFDDINNGRETDSDFNQSVWDEWNAKSHVAQAADALVADAELLHGLEALDVSSRRQFRFSMGPMNLDFTGFVGLRLNEHALHTWDVEVALDPTASLPADAAGAVVDNLEMITRFAGKPSGEVRTVSVHTVDPERDFTVSLTSDAVALAPGDPTDSPDLEIPAEAFVRLVCGRLDPAHTPPIPGAGAGAGALDELRPVFPGF